MSLVQIICLHKWLLIYCFFSSLLLLKYYITSSFSATCLFISDAFSSSVSFVCDPLQPQCNLSHLPPFLYYVKITNCIPYPNERLRNHQPLDNVTSSLTKNVFEKFSLNSFKSGAESDPSSPSSPQSSIKLSILISYTRHALFVQGLI